jgi:hypothetical protein
MAAVSAKGHRFAWILLVCGLVSLFAGAILAVVAILKGWTLTGSLRILSSFLLGLFWILLYRRGAKSASASEGNQPGPN